MTKKERIAAQIEKKKQERQELDVRIAELEKQFKEEETFEMHEMLRRSRLTPEELQQLLQNSPFTRK